MNVEQALRDLAETYLSDNHHVDGVRFVEELLLLAAQAGQVQGRLTSDGKLRFEASGGHVVEMELGRAKTKLRLLCARLSVLCNEAGYETMSVYGGEGVIGIESPAVSAAAGTAHARSGGGPSKDVATQETASRPVKCTIRFKNTMHEQEFTIIPE
jgi:hypothetical protein